LKNTQFEKNTLYRNSLPSSVLKLLFICAKLLFLHKKMNENQKHYRFSRLNV